MDTLEDFATKNPGLEPADTLRRYSDHTKLELLRSGQWDDQFVQYIDSELAAFGAENGLDPEALAKRPEQDDLRLTTQVMLDKDPAIADAARSYFVAQSDEARAKFADPALYEENLSLHRKSYEDLVTPEKRNLVKREAMRSGDLPFAVIDGALEFSPVMRDVVGNDEALAKLFEAHPNLDRSLIPAVKQKLNVAPGYDVPGFDLDRQSDFYGALQGVMAKDPDISAKMQELVGAYEIDKDTGMVHRTLDTGEPGVNDGPIAEAIASRLAINHGLEGDFSADEMARFVKDFAKTTASPMLQEGDVDSNVTKLSTGQAVLPMGVMLNKELFDRTMAESKAIPAEQKDALMKTRESRINAYAPDAFKLIADNRPEFTRFLTERKEKGATNASILDEWMSDPENHSSFRDYAGGIGESIVEGVGGLVLYPAALAGSESARGVIADLQKSDSDRRAYARMFGQNLGAGYDLSRLVAPVAADVGFSILTGGIGSAAVAGKSTVKTAIKSMLGRSLAPGTRTALTGFTKAAARRAGAEGVMAVDDVLTLAGKDIAGILTKSVNTASYLGTAFNRSAGSTYVQLHTVLSDQKNADGSPKYSTEQVREIALNHGLIAGTITAAVTGGFSMFGHAGMEGIYNGITRKQLGGIYDRMGKSWASLSPAVKAGVSMESPEKMLESIMRKSLGTIWGRGADAAISEGAEEGIDQILGYVNQQIATGEKIDINAAIREGAYASMLGGVMGGTVTGINSMVRGRSVAPDMERMVLLDTAMKLDKAKSPQTAAVLRKFAQQVGSVVDVNGQPVSTEAPDLPPPAGFEAETPAAKAPVEGEQTISEPVAGRPVIAKPGFTESDTARRLRESRGEPAPVAPPIEAPTPNVPNPQDTTPAPSVQLPTVPARTETPANLEPAGSDQEAARPAEAEVSGEVTNKFAEKRAAREKAESDDREQAPIKFTTARGSTYAVGESGTVYRNKYDGRKFRADKLAFVSEEDAAKIKELPSQYVDQAIRVLHEDGRVRFVIDHQLDTEQTILEVSAETLPAVGKVPVESAGLTPHIGDVVTSVESPTKGTPTVPTATKGNRESAPAAAKGAAKVTLPSDITRTADDILEKSRDPDGANYRYIPTLGYKEYEGQFKKGFEWAKNQWGDKPYNQTEWERFDQNIQRKIPKYNSLAPGKVSRDHAFFKGARAWGIELNRAEYARQEAAEARSQPSPTKGTPTVPTATKGNGESAPAADIELPFPDAEGRDTPEAPVSETRAPLTRDNVIARGEAAGYTFRPQQIEAVRKNNKMSISSLVKMVGKLEAKNPAPATNRKLIPTEGLTPMMTQYAAMRNSLPEDIILMYRLGDFYEMFFDDAKTAAKVMGVALTKRGTVPMAGIPYHAKDSYIETLLKAGHRVALAEQVGETKPGRLTEREATEILTPQSVNETSTPVTRPENVSQNQEKTNTSRRVTFTTPIPGAPSQGEVVSVNEKTGKALIKGDDGKRYPNSTITKEVTPAVEGNTSEIDDLVDDFKGKVATGMDPQGAAATKLKSKIGILIDSEVRLGDRYQLADVYILFKNGDITAEEFTKFHNELRIQLGLPESNVFSVASPSTGRGNPSGYSGSSTVSGSLREAPPQVDTGAAGGGKADAANAGSGGSNRRRSAYDIADDIAARGEHRQASYGSYVAQMGLKPEMDAKAWLKIYEEALSRAAEQGPRRTISNPTETAVIQRDIDRFKISVYDEVARAHPDLVFPEGYALRGDVWSYQEQAPTLEQRGILTQGLSESTKRQLSASAPGDNSHREALKGHDTSSPAALLASLAKSGPPKFKPIVKLLQQFDWSGVTLTLLDTNIPVPVGSALEGVSANLGGAWMKETGQIIITPDSSKAGTITITLHEMVHAATEKSLNKPNPAQKQAIKRIEGYIRAIKKARDAEVAKQTKLIAKLKEQIESGKAPENAEAQIAEAEEILKDMNYVGYGVSDTGEFLAHMLTSSGFRESVAELRPANETSFVKLLFDAIADLLLGKKKIPGVTGDMIADLTTFVKGGDTVLGVVRDAGSDARFMFAGEQAQKPQFMQDSLETARTMAAAGKTSEEIRAVTGWFPGKYDGKMRWEIPDAGAKARPLVGVIGSNGVQSLREGGTAGTTLGELLDHPALFEAYPDLKTMSVVFDPSLDSYGKYSPNSNTIFLRQRDAFLSEERLSTLLHEAQHAIQLREGVSYGADLQSAVWEAPPEQIEELRNEARKAFSTEGVDLSVTRYRDFISKIKKADRTKLDEALSSKDTHTAQDILGIPRDSFGLELRLSSSSDRLLSMTTNTETDLLARRNKMRESRSVTESGTTEDLRMLFLDYPHFAQKLYLANPGETEARDVQARAKLTPEQLKATAPYSSENIALEDAIVMGVEQGQARFSPTPEYARSIAPDDTDLSALNFDEIATELEDVNPLVAEDAMHALVNREIGHAAGMRMSVVPSAEAADNLEWWLSAMGKVEGNNVKARAHNKLVIEGKEKKGTHAYSTINRPPSQISMGRGRAYDELGVLVTDEMLNFNDQKSLQVLPVTTEAIIATANELFVAGFELENDGKTYLITPSTTSNSLRVTSLDGEGPTGHIHLDNRWFADDLRKHLVGAKVFAPTPSIRFSPAPEPRLRSTLDNVTTGNPSNDDRAEDGYRVRDVTMRMSPAPVRDDDTSRFAELTAGVTPENVETWKRENPEKHAELKAMREKVLETQGYRKKAYHGTPEPRQITEFKYEENHRPYVWFGEEQIDREGFASPQNEYMTVMVMRNDEGVFKVSTVGKNAAHGKTFPTFEAATKAIEEGRSKKKITERPAFFFASNPLYAENFMAHSGAGLTSRESGQSRMYEVVLREKRFLDFRDNAAKEWIQKWVNDNRGNLDREFGEKEWSSNTVMQNFKSGHWGVFEAFPKIADDMKASGYNGYVTLEGGTLLWEGQEWSDFFKRGEKFRGRGGLDSSINYAVFNPSDIKSTEPLSFDSDGELITPDQWGDTTSPDIRFSPAPEPRLRSTLDNVTTGNPSNHDRAHFIVNPEQRPALVSYLKGAANAMWDRLKTRFDLRTAVYVDRLVAEVARAESGYRITDATMRMSPAPMRDDDGYLAAVESGDMDTAQRMVDEAAKAAGYSSETFYHTATSGEPFTEFKYAALTGGEDRYKTNGHKAALTFTLEGLGAGWFTSNSSQFKGWRNSDASNVVRAKVNLKQPLVIQADPFVQQDFVNKKKELSDVRSKIKGVQDRNDYIPRDEFEELRQREKELAFEVDFSTFDEDQVLKLSEQLNETYTKKGIKDLERQIKKLSEKTGNKDQILKRRRELKYADPFYGLMSLSETAQQEYPDLIPGAAVRAALKEQGYDGIILEGTNADTALGDTTLATWVIPFDGGAAIKSAEPITYEKETETQDASGAVPRGKTVIPLSQRFNTASPDIRFSPAPATDDDGNLTFENVNFVFANDNNKLFVSTDEDINENPGWWTRMFTRRDDMRKPLSAIKVSIEALYGVMKSKLDRLAPVYKQGVKEEGSEEAMMHLGQAIGSNKPMLTPEAETRVNEGLEQRLKDAESLESPEVDAARKARAKVYRNKGSSDADLRAAEDEVVEARKERERVKRGKDSTEEEKQRAINLYNAAVGARQAIRDARAAADEAVEEAVASAKGAKITAENAAFEWAMKAAKDEMIAHADELRRVSGKSMEWLEGNAPKLHAWATEMRDTIDEFQTLLSEHYRDSRPEMAWTIDNSRGVYLTRTWRIHQDPAFAEMALHDPEFADKQNALIELFAKDLTETELKKLQRDPDNANVNEADLRITAYNNIQDKAKAMFQDYVMGHEFQASANVGSTGLKTEFQRFMRKRNLDTAIEDVLGRIDDPKFNADRTLAAVSGILFNQKMLTAIKDEGIQSGTIITEAQKNADKVKYRDWKPLVSANVHSAAYAPLAGYYASPRDVEAMNAAFGFNRGGATDTADKAMDTVNKIILGASGMSLATMTLGSVGYYVRNLFGGMVGSLAQGVIPLTSGYRDSARLAAQNAFSTQTGDIELREKLIALRIIGDGVQADYIKELRERYKKDPVGMLKWATAKGLKIPEAAKTGKMAWDKLVDVLERTAEFTETSHNAAVFFHDLDALVRSGLYETQEAAEQEAARINKMVMPSKSEKSQALDKFSGQSWSALVAPFARFRAEMFRTVVNTYRVGLEHARSDNEVLRKHGQQRLAMASFMHMGITVMVPLALQSLLDFSDEEDKAIRAALPSYSQSSQLWMWDKGNGSIRMLDLTYANQFSFVFDILPQIWRSRKDPLEMPEVIAKYVAGEVIGENIVAGSLLDVSRNMDEQTGNTLWLKTDDFSTKVAKATAHVLGSSYTPAVMKKTMQAILAGQRPEKEGEDFFYTPLGILTGMVLPAKPYDRKIDDMAYRAFRSLGRENRELWQITAPLSSPAGLRDTPAEIYTERVRAAVKVWGKAHRLAKSYESMGMSKAKILSAMTEAGLSQKRASMAMRGFAERPVLDADKLRDIRKIDVRRYDQFIEAMRSQPRILDVR